MNILEKILITWFLLSLCLFLFGIFMSMCENKVKQIGTHLVYASCSLICIGMFIGISEIIIKLWSGQYE